jgi:hypothetical protein
MLPNNEFWCHWETFEIIRYSQESMRPKHRSSVFFNFSLFCRPFCHMPAFTRLRNKQKKVQTTATTVHHSTVRRRRNRNRREDNMEATVKKPRRTQTNETEVVEQHMTWMQINNNADQTFKPLEILGSILLAFDLHVLPKIHTYICGEESSGLIYVCLPISTTTSSGRINKLHPDWRYRITYKSTTDTIRYNTIRYGPNPQLLIKTNINKHNYSILLQPWLT